MLVRFVVADQGCVPLCFRHRLANFSKVLPLMRIPTADLELRSTLDTDPAGNGQLKPSESMREGEVSVCGVECSIEV